MGTPISVLRQSIIEKGFDMSKGMILVSPLGPEKFVVKDGHHRVKILAMLGVRSIPVEIIREPHQRLHVHTPDNMTFWLQPLEETSSK
jgi:ParB-like chromosome segregation protein Spo0J